MDKLEKLKSRKLAVIAAMRALNDAETFNATEYEAHEAEVRTLDADIARETNLMAMEEANKRVDVIPMVEAPKARIVVNEEEFRLTDAFANYLRNAAVNVDTKTRAILNTLVGTEGGYLVPEVFMTNIIDKLQEVSVMRQNSTVVRTVSTTNIPLGNGRPTFAIIAENGTYPQTDASFAQAVLGAFKIGGIIKASDELLQDAFTNIQAYITKLSVEGIADAEEGYFTTGTGTGQAQGIVTASTLGVTTVAVASVTLDEVIDLIYSVKAPYRMNSKLMMNSSTEKAIRKLKDSNGQYLWQPSLQVGTPNSFDGYPIVINEKMASLGTGNKFMLFGDFKYYEIGDRGTMEIKRLDELYSATGEVGFRVNKRSDARLIITEAVKHMKNA